jgi:hypothetical protein
MAIGLRSSNAGPPQVRGLRRAAAASGRAGLAIAAGLLVLTGTVRGTSALGAPGAIPQFVTQADPPGLASDALDGGAVNRCALAAHIVGGHARDALSNAEWMDTRVLVAADGHVTVATRLASGLRRPLAAEVTVSFLTGAGARLAMVARSYRLAARSAHTSTAPKERVRAGVMQLQLAPSARCRLARVRISQRAIPS